MKLVNYLVTWMYSSSQGEKVVHHQTGGNSDQQKTQDLYWRCVFCLFESSHRNNRDLFKHILYVNKMPPEKIDGISTAELISAYNIEIREFVPTSLPPKGYYKAWTTQFLLLDIMKEVSAFVKPDDRVVILDSDCIFSKPANFDFLKDIDAHKALLYSIDYPHDRMVNGVSVDILRQLASEIVVSKETSELEYEGGEMICFKGEILEELLKTVRNAYNWSVHRFESGLPKFNTEEHAFSVAYWQLDLEPYTANKYIKRLWTDMSSAVNVEEGDEQRLIWHLPGEKKHGFIKYFRILGKNNYSLKGFEKELTSIFRITPSIGDKLAMMAMIPIKKTYKLLKTI